MMTLYEPPFYRAVSSCQPDGSAPSISILATWTQPILKDDRKCTRRNCPTGGQHHPGRVGSRGILATVGV